MIIQNKLIKNIANEFFESNIIKREDEIIIALSGGIDSMCLFDIFYKLTSIYDFGLTVICINHGIRNEEALRDVFFVEKYCESLNVKCIIKNVNAKDYAKENKISLEEAARILRYQQIDDLWKELKKQYSKNEVYVTIAHHMNDQIETIIHNMIRGTGIKGLSGMNQIKGYIIRPLLGFTKKDIQEYIKEFAIPYVEDSTNDDLNITRNYIRKEIIKRFQKINDKSIEHIYNLSLKLQELNIFVEEEAKKYYEQIKQKQQNNLISINLKEFNKLQNIIKSEIIKLILKTLVNTNKDITNTHINDIINLSIKEKGGHIDLPYNILVDKKKNELIFSKSLLNQSMTKRRKK